MWAKGISLVSGVMMTHPEVMVARASNKIFVTPQGITSYFENLFDCGSARGMTDHFFSTLRQCNTTWIIETVNGSGVDGLHVFVFIYICRYTELHVWCIFAYMYTEFTWMCVHGMIVSACTHVRDTG